jgi:soluble lytic murein transglycosylase-like protein
MIGNAILGLVLALATYTILNLINPRLVILKSLNITPIKRIELEFKSEKGASVGGWTGKNITTYDKTLESAANKYNLDCTRLKAHMLIESGGNPNVVSWANACGLMQLLPTTAGTTCEELKDPEVNISIAAQYYKRLQLNTCPKSTSIKRKSGQIEKVNCHSEKTECKNNSLKYVTAAYNGGIGANCSSTNSNCLGQTFWECEENLGYKETRDYVQKVNATYLLLKEKDWGC